MLHRAERGRGIMRSIAGLLFVLVIASMGPARSQISQAGESAHPSWASCPGQKALHDLPLPTGAIARMGVTRLRHGGYLHGLTYSPDGRSLASWGSDGFIRVWDSATGRQRYKLFGDDHGVSSLAFAVDGKMLRAACGKGRVRAWDAGTGKPLAELERSIEPCEKWVLSQDGNRVALSDGDGWLAVCDVAAGSLPRRLRKVDTGERVMAISPNGRLVLSAIASSYLLRLWDAETGKQQALMQGPSGAKLFTAGFAADGQTLASAGYGSIYLWGASSGKMLRQLSTDDKLVWALAFAPVGAVLASGDSSSGAIADGHVTLWDAREGKRLRELRGHTGGVECLAFSPDGKTIASGGWDHAVRVWDTASGRELFASDGQSGAVRCTGVSPDGKLLASGGWDAMVRLWDPRTGRELRRLIGHRDPVLSVAFTPDGKTVVSTSADGTIRQWDAATGTENEAARTEGHAGAYSLDGSYLAWASASIHLCDAATRKQLFKLDGHGWGVDSLVFSPAGVHLASTSSNEAVVRLWHVATGRLLRQLPLFPGGASTVAFSTDARMLAARVGKNTMRLWETDTGRPIVEVDVRESIQACAFCPGDRVLALACGGHGMEHRVRLWDLAVSKEVGVLPGHEGAINALGVSTDGSMLVSASSDTSLIAWDLRRFVNAVPAEASLEQAEIKALWADLLGDDAAPAFRARWKLAAAPKQAVAFLAEQLRPRSADPQERVSELIRDLDSDDFVTRDAAARAIERMGSYAELELVRALQRPPSLEFRRRVEQLLAKLDAGSAPPLSGDMLRRIRAIALLEHLASAEAEALLQTLATRPMPGREAREAQAALARLARRTPR
jgi:WD40 repeat protein